MKTKSIIIIAGILIILSLLIFRFFNRPIVNTPKRLSNIPKEAKWIGGSDGGNWFQIVNVISPSEYNIKIFNDYTGELIIDTLFILEDKCRSIGIDSANLINSLSGYDGETIHLTKIVEKRNCYLKPK